MALAAILAKEGRRAVIINADASQVYADIPILSAAPSASDRAGVPHRLFGTLDGATPCNAAMWAELARQEIDAAQRGDALAIIVGGTGLYLRSLIHGIAALPAIDAHIRDAVRALPLDQAHAELTQLDPASAARLPATDKTRVQRALEVVRATGRSLTAWQADQRASTIGPLPHVATVLLPPRPWLQDRIAARIAHMVSAGVVDEVARLLARQLDPELPVMRAIGVAELSAYVAGAVTLEAAMEQLMIATRQYAKRQSTWFRNQSPAEWERHDTELNEQKIIQIATLLRQMLLT